TTLLRVALPDAKNIFVWPNKSMEWILLQINKELGIPHFKNFSDAVEYLLDNGNTVIIDEFQNFLGVDKSVYGELQKLIDERKLKGKKTRIAAAGSSYSLMNKVFNDAAAPLYGRRTHEMRIENLPLRDLFLELKMPLTEFIPLWSVFEGIPYYYERLNRKQTASENIYRLLLSKEAQLQGEGELLLSSEFGKESKTYGTVLTAIAEGKTKLNEISTLFGDRKNETVKYLDLLRKEFLFVRKTTPVTADPEKSREGKYEIIDNFLSFWFRFLENRRNYIEQERFGEQQQFFHENFTSFVGKKFEKLAAQLIKEGILFREAGYTAVGPQWGKTTGEKGKNAYEIDLIAFNEKTREVLFAECKWQNRVNPKKTVLALMEKARHVQWHPADRKETYAVFAKSFSRPITQFQGKKVHCISLKEIENALRE
ncbi:MAG: ATP-binding protein, partial [Candidatus Diapherotrites archaeon]|nr:ATP-binding protein [Candidatus Diapherotrites archaeon]